MNGNKVLELKYSDEYGEYGSKEHFFHFFWGYVLPGMHVAITTTRREPGTYSLTLEDCGPVMNKVSQDLFSLITADIKFKKSDEFSADCAQVPRWDIMINFDSVLFEDEHSFRGSTKNYRENEFLKSVLNQPGFLQNFQNELREVRSWVLGRVIDSEAAASSLIIPSVGELKLSGPPATHGVKKAIIKFLERQGPWHVQLSQKVLQRSINVVRMVVGKTPIAISPKRQVAASQKTPVAASRKRRRNGGARGPNCLLLCRSPEPEYYSENGQAEAKKYGASRRSLVEIDESFEYFKSKGHNIEKYEPGSENIFGQIKRFYASDAVIGIKGAELSNVFWMKPGSKMFVVTPSTMRSTPVYQRFSRFLGISSITVFGADGQNPSLYRLRREIDDQL
ncbi:hypothetical protein GCM10007913_31760 [Devosia yakushimensis]|uniref:Glycosyltransferase 61 catalytic domain-containing protein n=1 Tax=Devosia yakushimensis TaxID=470028 RepID=A0ABQ5UJC8_9HYPH|nr:glycosyltransferase 61 family protein [Devosia yakushimensis]GLQ11244.1 hypothetical protein GCM10007913_31760 [Devosia yakushimensis]